MHDSRTHPEGRKRKRKAIGKVQKRGGTQMSHVAIAPGEGTRSQRATTNDTPWYMVDETIKSIGELCGKEGGASIPKNKSSRPSSKRKKNENRCQCASKAWNRGWSLTN